VKGRIQSLTNYIHDPDPPNVTRKIRNTAFVEKSHGYRNASAGKNI
jgi:hypothetical protein